MEKKALLITCLVLLICTKEMMARNLKTSYKKEVSLEPKHHVLVSKVTPAFAFGMLNVAAPAFWPGLANNIYTAMIIHLQFQMMLLQLLEDFKGFRMPWPVNSEDYYL